MPKIKCNKCGFIGDKNEFKIGNDFFQNPYIAGCPNCDNTQNPSDASMRGLGGERPFSLIREEEPTDDVLNNVLHRASEAS